MTIVLVAGVGLTTHHVPDFLQRHPLKLPPVWPRPGGMTVLGGEPPIDWDALAPHIEHPARESIVEALRWIGPLSSPDLKGVLDEPESHLAYVAYHVTVLVREEVVMAAERRSAGAAIEKLYFFTTRQ